LDFESPATFFGLTAAPEKNKSKSNLYMYQCPECGPVQESKAEHDDFHMAEKLQREIRHRDALDFQKAKKRKKGQRDLMSIFRDAGGVAGK